MRVQFDRFYTYAELTETLEACIASGKEREEAGQLGGRVERRQVNWWGTDHSTAERTLVEWVIEASAGDRVAVVARHERAGTVRSEVVL